MMGHAVNLSSELARPVFHLTTLKLMPVCKRELMISSIDAIELAHGIEAAPYPAASTFRGGVCTTGASSGAPNDCARRSFPTGR